MSLDQADFTPRTGIEWRGDIGVVQYGNSRGMVCMFYNKSVQDPTSSAAAGRPVFKDQVFVRIHPPGERLNIWDQPATDKERRRFPMEWAAFQQNREQIPEGTPVDLLYPDHPSIARTLRAASVHTIEQLVELSAHAIEDVGMGCQRWVNDAVRYMEMANKGVTATQHRRDVEKMESENRVLHQQIEQLKAEIARVSAGGRANDDIEARIQAAVAGALNRPTIPTKPTAQFDAQAAMINATHATALVKKKVQPKKAPPRKTAASA